MDTLEILLRGLAVGATLCTALGLLGGGLLRGGVRTPARWTGALFCLSAACFALNSGGAVTDAVRALLPPIWFLSLGGSGLFWMFAVTLFDDRPFGIDRWLPPLVMTLVGIVG